MRQNRIGEVVRQTGETQIRVEVNLDGSGQCEGRVPLGFLWHMLQLLSRHGGLDLRIEAEGDLEVDDHHLTEDLGICLGQALARAWGEKKGIERYGSILLPMDEVLVAVAVDLSGRFSFYSDYSPQRERVGDLSTELVPHFFRSLAAEARMNLHFRFLASGENEHHRIEAMFKGFARSLRAALRIDPGSAGEVPSTKGVI